MDDFDVDAGMVHTFLTAAGGKRDGTSEVSWRTTVNPIMTDKGNGHRCIGNKAPEFLCHPFNMKYSTEGLHSVLFRVQEVGRLRLRAHRDLWWSFSAELDQHINQSVAGFKGRFSNRCNVDCCLRTPAPSPKTLDVCWNILHLHVQSAVNLCNVGV